jgi:hypothetical protein
MGMRIHYTQIVINKYADELSIKRLPDGYENNCVPDILNDLYKVFEEEIVAKLKAEIIIDHFRDENKLAELKSKFETVGNLPANINEFEQALNRIGPEYLGMQVYRDIVDIISMYGENDDKPAVNWSAPYYVFLSLYSRMVQLGIVSKEGFETTSVVNNMTLHYLPKRSLQFAFVTKTESSPEVDLSGDLQSLAVVAKDELLQENYLSSSSSSSWSAYFLKGTARVLSVLVPELSAIPETFKAPAASAASAESEVVAIPKASESIKVITIPFIKYFVERFVVAESDERNSLIKLLFSREMTHENHLEILRAIFEYLNSTLVKQDKLAADAELVIRSMEIMQQLKEISWDDLSTLLLQLPEDEFDKAVKWLLSNELVKIQLDPKFQDLPPDLPVRLYGLFVKVHQSRIQSHWDANFVIEILKEFKVAKNRMKFIWAIAEHVRQVMQHHHDLIGIVRLLTNEDIRSFIELFEEKIISIVNNLDVLMAVIVGVGADDRDRELFRIVYKKHMHEFEDLDFYEHYVGGILSLAEAISAIAARQKQGQSRLRNSEDLKAFLPTLNKRGFYRLDPVIINDLVMIIDNIELAISINNGLERSTDFPLFFKNRLLGVVKSADELEQCHRGKKLLSSADCVTLMVEREKQGKSLLKDRYELKIILPILREHGFNKLDPILINKLAKIINNIDLAISIYHDMAPENDFPLFLKQHLLGEDTTLSDLVQCNGGVGLLSTADCVTLITKREESGKSLVRNYQDLISALHIFEKYGFQNLSPALVNKIVILVDSIDAVCRLVGKLKFPLFFVPLLENNLSNLVRESFDLQRLYQNRVLSARKCVAMLIEKEMRKESLLRNLNDFRAVQPSLQEYGLEKLDLDLVSKIASIFHDYGVSLSLGVERGVQLELRALVDLFQPSHRAMFVLNIFDLVRSHELQLLTAEECVAYLSQDNGFFENEVCSDGDLLAIFPMLYAYGLERLNLPLRNKLSSTVRNFDCFNAIYNSLPPNGRRSFVDAFKNKLASIVLTPEHVEISLSYIPLNEWLNLLGARFIHISNGLENDQLFESMLSNFSSAEQIEFYRFLLRTADMTNLDTIVYLMDRVEIQRESSSEPMKSEIRKQMLEVILSRGDVKVLEAAYKHPLFGDLNEYRRSGRAANAVFRIFYHGRNLIETTSQESIRLKIQSLTLPRPRLAPISVSSNNQ